jgi:hypothetical protein
VLPVWAAFRLMLHSAVFRFVASVSRQFRRWTSPENLFRS